MLSRRKCMHYLKYSQTGANLAFLSTMKLLAQCLLDCKLQHGDLLPRLPSSLVLSIIRSKEPSLITRKQYQGIDITGQERRHHQGTGTLGSLTRRRLRKSMQRLLECMNRRNGTLHRRLRRTTDVIESGKLCSTRCLAIMRVCTVIIFNLAYSITRC